MVSGCPYVLPVFPIISDNYIGEGDSLWFSPSSVFKIALFLPKELHLLYESAALKKGLEKVNDALEGIGGDDFGSIPPGTLLQPGTTLSCG